MISQDTLNKIYDLSIVDVVGSRITLKKNKACCPFHNEKTESFSVHPAKNFFKCFGCGKGGNVVKFIMEHDKLNFIDAIYKLGADHNIHIYTDVEYDPKVFAEKKQYLADSQAVLEYVHSMYAKVNKTPIVAYMQERGFSTETISKWGMLYAPDDWRYITPSIVDKGSLEMANKLGYVVTNDGKNFDMYRNRLLIPIHDAYHNLVGFAGRILNDDKPKYLNPKESLLYIKSKVLFGLNHAIPAIKEHGFAILMEGYLDVIRAYEHGTKNAVAPCGTACDDAQIKLLKQYTNKVTIWYDGDRAGQEATEKRVAQLMQHGMEATVINVPGMDPDEYYKNYATQKA